MIRDTMVPLGARFGRPAARSCSIELRAVALLIGGIMPAGGALAHHSYAAYDSHRTNTEQATLVRFDWSAPHSSMTVAYLDKAGKQQKISATTGAPLSIVQQGFKISDFKAGRKVELTWYPNRNGLPGGEMGEMKLPDGRVLRGHGFEQPGDPNSPGAPPAKAN